MTTRRLPRVKRPAFPRYTPIHPASFSARHTLHARRAHTATTISDPPNASAASSISLAHPKDPGGASGPSSNTVSGDPQQNASPSSPSPSSSSSPSSPEPDVSSSSSELVPAPAGQPPPPATNLPSPQIPFDASSGPQYTNPPFHTHQFFTELEKTFPTPVARNIMRATRALLVDRIGHVRSEALTAKDLESQAYLFRAALSELRRETTMLTRNETAAVRAATAAVRREVDALDVRMKEDVGALKHDIQMDLDNRKNEAKDDLKRYDIQVEDLLSKYLVALYELRTQMEGVRWDNLRNSVAALSGFLLLMVVSMELLTTRQAPAKARSPPPPQPPILEIRPPESSENQPSLWT